MKTVIDDLIEDHRRFRILLNQYERELAALRNGREIDYNLLNDLAEYFCLFPDELHHRKEDIIYEFLLELGDNLSTSPSQGDARLYDLRAEHASISNDAEIFREGVAQAVAGAQLPRDQLTHRGDEHILHLRQHMRREEESLFPRALAAIDESGWDIINKRFGDLLAEEVNLTKAREVLKIEKSLLQRAT